MNLTEEDMLYITKGRSNKSWLPKYSISLVAAFGTAIPLTIWAGKAGFGVAIFIFVVWLFINVWYMRKLDKTAREEAKRMFSEYAKSS